MPTSEATVSTPRRREMESNIKTLLRHRLLIYDRKLLETKIIRSAGCDQMLSYVDDEDFFDPVATPQASYALASRMLIDADSSFWTYEVREGRYTLTRYYNSKEVLEKPLSVTPQTLAGAFGSSDFSSDFWGHYNWVPINVYPLQLLKNKFHKL